MKMDAKYEIDTTASDIKALSAFEYANALTIKSPEDYKKADSFCKGLFDLRKSIQNDFADSITKAKATKKAATEALAALVEQEEGHTKPVQDAERIIKTKLFAWNDEQEVVRRKEQDRLRAEALKRAEDEKLRRAAALEAQGKEAQALAELDKPINVAPVIAPKLEMERETKLAQYWSYDVSEAGSVNREYCKPDPGAIQKALTYFKSQGKTIAEVEAIIGGIRIEAKVK
jgi:hypothetical protein